MNDYDVVIVGAGTAGIPCAIEASVACRVLVIDRANEIGGTLAVSAGHMSAAGARRQREAGIVDDPALHFNDVMSIGGSLADPDLVRRATELAGPTIDWLEDLGFDFDPETPTTYHGHTPYSRPRTFWGRRKGLSILETMRPLWNAAVDAGRIELRTNTSVLGLETTSDRSVRGVVLDAGSGPERVGAEHVVLASGGYGANGELFAELTPGRPRLVTNAMPTSTGDALRWGSTVGGVLRNGELHTPRLGLLEDPPGSGRVDFWTKMLNLTAAERPPHEIWVNQHGRRFVAEDATDVTRQEHAAMAQPGSRMWIVFDHAALGRSIQPLVRQWTSEHLMAEAERGDLVKAAESLEALAAVAGLDAAGLVETVNSFNSSTVTGSDEFGRTAFHGRLDSPPFYAIATSPAVLCTFGGLTVDCHLRVLRENGTPIDGLFAVGEALGMGATSGRAFCGGMAVTPALAFGRLVGKELSDRAVARS